MNRIIGIDPGNVMCGVAILDGGHLICAFNVDSQCLLNKLTAFLLHPNSHIAVEDIIASYGGLDANVVDTIKFIGELSYRLRIECGATVEMIPRGMLRQWVFDAVPEVCRPLVAERMKKRLSGACDIRTREEILVDARGRRRMKESFVYMNDRIIQAAMKAMWGLKKEPGRKSWPFGLSSHNWQALAVASCSLHKTACQRVGESG